MDLTIQQGATFRVVFAWQESDGTPVPMTGLRARMQVRPKVSGPDLDLALTDAPDGGLTVVPDAGEVHVYVSAVRTAAMQSGGPFDLELYDPLNPGEVTRLVEGKVILSPEVTR